MLPPIENDLGFVRYAMEMKPGVFVAGDLFDFAFKPHLRNLALLDRWRGDPTRTVRRTRLMLVVVPVAIVLMAVVTLALAIVGLVALTRWLA